MSWVLVALTLLLSVWVFPYVWFAIVKNQIDLEIRFSPRYVVVGDAVEIHCRLTNRSRLPCPFVEIALALPVGLSVSLTSEERFVRFGTHLDGRQEMEVVLHSFAVKRGSQRLQNYPIYVKINEGLGLKELTLSRVQNSHMTVMPALIDDTQDHVELKALSGKIERFHWLQPDESLLRGIREYHPGDPFKYIAWQSSAAHGNWMVKQFSASTEAAVALILNAQMFPEYWSGTRHAEFDRLCELVAAYAEELQDRGFQLKFFTNAVAENNPSQRFFGQLSAHSIRALLGELEPYASSDFLPLIDDYFAQAPISETALIFSSYEGAVWKARFQQQQRQGRNVEFVFGPDPVIEETSPTPTLYGEAR